LYAHNYNALAEQKLRKKFEYFSKIYADFVLQIDRNL